MEIISRAQAKSVGLMRYFTGKPCKHGHVAERQVAGWQCVECHREWDRRHRDTKDEWRIRNYEKVKERQRGATRRHREKDLEKAREYDRLWQQRRRQANPQLAREKRNAIARRHRKSHPEAVRTEDRLTKHRRRAQKLGSESTLTVAEWQQLVARSPRCHWCKRLFNRKRRRTHDHVIPLIKEGADTLENSVCACFECNVRKNAKLINPVTGQGILL